MSESFEKTKIAGSIAAGALDEVNDIIKPGISTSEIDKLCYEFINDHKAFILRAWGAEPPLNPWMLDVFEHQLRIFLVSMIVSFLGVSSTCFLDSLSNDLLNIYLEYSVKNYH